MIFAISHLRVKCLSVYYFCFFCLPVFFWLLLFRLCGLGVRTSVKAQTCVWCITVKKWCTFTTDDTLPWCTIEGVFNFFTTVQEHIPLKIKIQHRAHIHTGWTQNSVAETLVAVICKKLSNIPYIFRHYDLLDLNKTHEKKLQVNDNSFTNCHTEGVITKAN